MKVDSREPQKIKDAFPDATVESLEIGDITSDDMTTIIERKTMDDLLASIFDGRYKDQVRTLINLPSFMIVVGELSYRNKDKSRYVHGAIASLQYKYRIPTFTVADDNAFIRKVKSIMKKRENISDLDVVIKRIHNDPQLNLFCSIPNIGTKKAKALYEKYNSMTNLCCSTVNDIQMLPGFGMKTAKHIIDTLRNIKDEGRPLP